MVSRVIIKKLHCPTESVVRTHFIVIILHFSGFFLQTKTTVIFTALNYMDVHASVENPGKRHVTTYQGWLLLPCPVQFILAFFVELQNMPCFYHLPFSLLILKKMKRN